MKILKTGCVAFALLLALATTLPVAHASEANQATQLTFNQPIEIPGQILPAGTYWFQLPTVGSNRDLVQIFNFDRTQIIASLITVPRERQEATDATEVDIAQKESDQSNVLKAWFYPGDTSGHEFMYSQHVERELQPELIVLASPVDMYSNNSVVDSGD